MGSQIRKKRGIGFKKSIKYGKTGSNFIQVNREKVEFVSEYEKDGRGNIFHNVKCVGDYIIMGKFRLANKRVKIGKVDKEGIIKNFDYRKNLYLNIMEENEVYYRLHDEIYDFVKKRGKNYSICEKCLKDSYKIFDKIKERKNRILIYYNGGLVFSSKYYSKGVLSYILYANMIILEGYLKIHGDIGDIKDFRNFKDEIISDEEFNLIKNNIEEDAIKIVEVLRYRIKKMSR